MKSINKKNLWIVPAYGIFYLIVFFMLESRQASYQVIYSPLDDLIPFCEYFIIPYVLWFVFMAATVVYFMFINDSVEEYRKLVSMLGTGMTVFLLVSFVAPNCHELRSTLPQDGNIFVKAVKVLYAIDTPTNLLPSIHVFNTLACYTAITNNERCLQSKVIHYGSKILSILIVLSTVFLKQHSVIDVSIAFLFFGICYGLFYWFIPNNQERFDQIMNPKEIMTIPNMLSMFRLFLGILFWGIGTGVDFAGKQTVMIVTLVVSGITDFLDGQIARKYDMVSEFGKLLDPIADKVTQGVLLLYLLERHPMIRMTLMLFLIKELGMFLASSRLLLLTGNNEGARWYGKVSTTVFYVVMIILVVFPSIPLSTANVLIGLCSICLAGSFALYMNYYITEYNKARGKTRWPA